MFIVLGTMTSITAQSFNFSCITEEVTVFIETEQAADLVVAGFTEGRYLPDGATDYIATPNSYAVNIQITPDDGPNRPGQRVAVYIDAQNNGNDLEYVITTFPSSGSLVFSNFDMAVIAAQLAVASLNPSAQADGDSDGFSNAEESILVAAGFVPATNAIGQFNFYHEGVEIIQLQVGEDFAYEAGYDLTEVFDYNSLTEVIASLDNYIANL